MRTDRLSGMIYGTYRKVDETQRDLKRKFSLRNLLGLGKDKPN